MVQASKPVPTPAHTLLIIIIINRLNSECAFGALTLLDGRQEGPVKDWMVGCWHGYVSESRCRFAYGPADATATYYLLLQ